MTRVEKNARIEQRFTDMKEEVVDEVKRRPRRLRPWLSCSLILFAVLVGFLVWGLWTTAATGLVRIPVFTDLAYEVAIPKRPVTPGVPAQTVMSEAFASTLTRRLYEGEGTLSDRSITVSLEEGSLTASLRSFFEEEDFDWMNVSGVQVVVDPEVGVEVFVPILGRELTTAVTLTLDFWAQEGNLMVAPVKILVGNVQIPDFLVTVFLKPLLQAQLAKLNTMMVGYAKISTIEILPRTISLSGELSVEIESAL